MDKLSAAALHTQLLLPLLLPSRLHCILLLTGASCWAMGHAAVRESKSALQQERPQWVLAGVLQLAPGGRKTLIYIQ